MICTSCMICALRVISPLAVICTSCIVGDGGRGASRNDMHFVHDMRFARDIAFGGDMRFAHWLGANGDALVGRGFTPAENVARSLRFLHTMAPPLPLLPADMVKMRAHCHSLHFSLSLGYRFTKTHDVPFRLLTSRKGAEYADLCYSCFNKSKAKLLFGWCKWGRGLRAPFREGGVSVMPTRRALAYHFAQWGSPRM